MEPWPKKVLLVEDDEALIDLVQLAFAGEEIELGIAVNGNEAIQKAEVFHPDLILMDVIMPEMNGYDATRRIKKNPRTRDIPVFFLTARGLENDIEEGKRCGAELYLVKPFSPFELIRVIHDFFATKIQST